MVSPYSNQPVDCLQPVVPSKAGGKTVVLTGGSSGLGLAYVEALTRAGAFVVNGDLNPPSQTAMSDRTVFVKCDVSSWDDQVNLFRVAKEKAPNGRIDAVIANAGIYGPDILEGLSEEQPTKPNTSMLNVNLIGVMYTTRLAAWHFDRQNSIDPCVILSLTSSARFIATPILREAFVESTRRQFEAQGVDFALTDDAVTAVFKLITDESINGKIGPSPI
ncbi:hypothetical protein ABOM_003794 [Aspergillus bombycis]|uniref:Uncharacterized protein n=1 Tax=Aspergillus bombycis TaxID=109264 RepID=A0A1F8A696_9EURO|nr:hypothetical protein ABOM_003794 [Aspergillus bombycis]OGM47290.1 hypothetical protein ABOM_003794 [Aspergillus bombycis]